MMEMENEIQNAAVDSAVPAPEMREPEARPAEELNPPRHAGPAGPERPPHMHPHEAPLPPHMHPHEPPLPPHMHPHEPPLPPHMHPHEPPLPPHLRHPAPRPSVMESERYRELGTDEKILALLRELGHAGRFGPDGRGSQNRILRLLAQKDAMTQRELTEQLGIRPGSSSEVLAKLEGAGLITRRPDETDRRVMVLALTETGKARAQAGGGETDAFLSGLDGTERETLLTLLEKLAAGLRAAEAPGEGSRGDQA